MITGKPYPIRALFTVGTTLFHRESDSTRLAKALKTLDLLVVQDLLPLYHDGVCSDKSRAAVEEHLQTCQDCRKALEEMDTQLPTEKVAVDDAAAVKKISREWERGKWKARMKGAGIAVLVCLLLFGGWIAATE